MTKPRVSFGHVLVINVSHYNRNEYENLIRHIATIEETITRYEQCPSTLETTDISNRHLTFASSARQAL